MKEKLQLKHSLRKGINLIVLILAMMLPFGAWADELTVCDGTTTNAYIPFHGYYADCSGQKSQMVFPSSSLTSMSGSNISKIRFYSVPGYQNSWTATWQVYLMEVENATISSFYDETKGTLVYQGTFSVSSDNYLDIPFSTEFEYNGGNLMVCTKLTVTGDCPNSNFYGVTSTGSSLNQKSNWGNAEQQNFLPKTTFTYESAGPKYDITYGTTTISGPAQSAAGRTVNVTVADGYAMNTLRVAETDNPTNYTDYPGATSFTMPAYNVTVSATLYETEVTEVFSEEFFKNTSDDNRPYSRDVWSEEGSGTHWGFSSTNHSPEASAFHWVNTSKMVTPELNLNLSTSATVSFWVKIPEYYYYGYYNDALYIYYRTSSTDSWKSLKTYDEVIADFTEKTITLPAEALTPTCQLAFQVSVEYSNKGGVFVDDVIVNKVAPVLPGHTITKIENNCAITTMVNGVEMNKAEAGATVTLTCTPNEHFTWNSWSVYKTGEPTTIVTVTNHAFTMPDYPVTVEAVLNEETKYIVTYASLEHGSFGNNTQTAFYANDLVSFSVTPNTNYIINTVTATDSDEGNVEVSHTSGNFYQFTMPAKNVTVNATFTQVEQLTVYDEAGSSNKTPFYVFYADDFTKVNMIMPASDLAQMIGANISAMTFYINSGAGSNTANWQVYLKETDDTQVSTPIDVGTATKVYEGQLDFTGTTVTVNFSTPFHYNGNNLLIATQNTTDPGYKDIYFTGNLSAGTDVSGYASNSSSLSGITSLTKTSFLPKTTFTYPPVPGFLITKVNTNCTISTTVGGNEGTRAEEGETVTLACTPNTHYTFDSWSVYKTGDPSTTVTVTDNTFEMPAYDVTVAANLTEDAKYAVTPSKVDGDGNPLGENQGYLSVDPTISYAGGNITIVCDNENHWNYQSVEILTTDDEPTGIVPEGSEGNYTFTMPAYAVKVQVTFTEDPTYTINVVKFGGDGNSITLSPASPTYANEIVTVTASPVAGYMLGRLVVRKDATGEEVTVTNKQFTMPAENVTVYASFYEGFEFFEDFETNPADNGWTYSSSGSGNWQWATGGHTGKCVYCSYSNAQYSPYIITPSFNLAGHEGLTMTFWRKQPNYSGNCEELNVKYTLDNGANWNLIANYNTVTDGYVETTIAIPTEACIDGVKFGFQAIYHDALNVYVDDVRIFEAILPSYSITPSVTGNGTLSFSPTGNVEVGTTVTVTASATGAALTSLSYLREDGRTIEIDIESLPYTFTMPECNTTVTAVFEEAAPCTVTLHVNGLTIGSEDNAYVGCPFELPATIALEGYTFYGWTNAEIPSSTTTAPAKVAEPSATEFIPTGDCDIYAVFAKAEVGDTYTLMSTPSFENGGSYIIGFADAWGNVDPHAIDITGANATLTLIQESSTGVITSEAMHALALTANYSSTTGGYCLTNGINHLTENNSYEIASGSTASTVNDAFEIASDGYELALKSMIGNTNHWAYFYYYNSAVNFSPSSWGSEIKLYKAAMTNTYYTYVADAPIDNSLTINGNASVTNPIIIGSDAVVTMNGTFTNSDASYLVINDGGQLVHSTNGVKATVKKGITGYGFGGGNYYLIASPMTEALTATSVNGLLTTDYDFYQFSQSSVEEEWNNYKVNSFGLVANKGYLYASSADTEIDFAGTLNATAEPIILDYDGNTAFAGYNLVGNPFACNASVSGSNSNAFYKMNAEGTEVEAVVDPVVAPCTGLFAVASAANQTVTFSKNTSDEPTVTRGMLTATISKANNRGNTQVDRAIVSFSEINALPKFNLNAGNSKLYIPQGEKNYAVVSTASEGTLPLCFEANKNGKYTLSFSTENLEVEYLHLIDNLTGADIDLLVYDSYTFESNSSDYASRFKLVFKAKVDNDEVSGNGSFAYINNGDIVISIEGRANLQIIDMMGRVHSSLTIVGDTRISTNGMTAGVYILNLNGMTQKIVIR